MEAPVPPLGFLADDSLPHHSSHCPAMGSRYGSVDPVGLSAGSRRMALPPERVRGGVPPAAEGPRRTADGDVPGDVATAS